MTLFHPGNICRISGLCAPQTDHGAAAPKPKRKHPAGYIPPNHRARAVRAKPFVSPVVEGDDDEGSGDGEDGPPRKPLRLLSKEQVLERVPLSFQSIWRLMQEGSFPQSRVIGGNKSAWLEADIDAWIKSAPLRPVILRKKGGE